MFLVRACRGSEHAPQGELFRVLVRDPELIAEGRALIGAGNVKLVAGPLRGGSGGFNQPWSWHLDPGGVRFAEGAIELCDACPSFVESDLPYWLGTVGSFCPWTTEVVARER